MTALPYVTYLEVYIAETTDANFAGGGITILAPIEVRWRPHRGVNSAEGVPGKALPGFPGFPGNKICPNAVITVVTVVTVVSVETNLSIPTLSDREIARSGLRVSDSGG